jgi:hypothetical protein
MSPWGGADLVAELVAGRWWRGELTEVEGKGDFPMGRHGHGHGDGGQRRAELTEVRWRSAVEDTSIGRCGGVKRRRPGHRATRWR